MSEAVVQLKIAGQTYRVVTSASAEDISRLVSRVEDALRSVTVPGRQPAEQSMVLAAITLAHELEEERRARAALEARYELKLRELLGLVDRALGSEPELDGVEREFGRIAKTLAPPAPSSAGEQDAASETLELPFVYVPRRVRELEAVGSDG